MKKGVVFFFVSIVYTLSFGQTSAKDDLVAISKKYALQNSFTASVTYSLFIDGRLDSKETARVNRKDSLFQYKLSDLEIVNGLNYKLYINHIAKEISVMPPERVNTNNIFRIPLDSAIAESESFSREEINPSSAKITLLYSGMPYDKVEFYYQKNSYVLNKVKIYFSPLQGFAEDFGIGKQNANAKLEFEVAIDTYVVNPSIDRETFSESKYITVKGKQIALANSYKNYELYNFLIVE